MDSINEIARRHDLYVIEDAAQSFGVTSKPLGAYGDVGACFTRDPELANVLRQIRDHGQDYRYHHLRLGVNGRMDSLQAAVLLSKLEIFLMMN